MRHGAGSSDGRTLTVLEVDGRLVVTERTSALSVGLGPAFLRWMGPASITVSLTPALGIEYFDETVLATAALRGGLGLGITLSETKREHRSGPWWPELQALDDGHSITLLRSRTLLTLELTGATDARSRQASFAAGLLVGLAWSEEQYEVEAPAFLDPHRLFNGGRRRPP